MRFRKSIFAFILLCLSAQFCWGQKDAKNNLLASIEAVGACEFVLQHVDFLIEELEKNPDSVGYIVISRQRQKMKKYNLSGFFPEDVISLNLKSRQWWYLNQNRVRIVRAESEKNKIDFLIVPKESNKPDFTEVKWDFNIPTKPILFDEGDGGQLCAETPFRLNAFAEILRDYPKARGHFVIYGASFKSFPKEKQYLTEEINKVGIPLKRFKFFFKKDNLTIYPYAKLWLIPHSK